MSVIGNSVILTLVKFEDKFKYLTIKITIIFLDWFKKNSYFPLQFVIEQFVTGQFN